MALEANPGSGKITARTDKGLATRSRITDRSFLLAKRRAAALAYDE